MRNVVGKLEGRDRSSLSQVNREVRQDTLAALPPQAKLWRAVDTENIELLQTAIEEGARVNKINPSVGMNALKMV